MIYILSLNYNGEKLLPKLLSSTKKALSGISYKWLIKDNNSTDASLSTLYEEQKNNPNIKIYNYPNNDQNFSEGMNYLFDKTNASDDDFILLLNNDIEFVDYNSINNMIELFKDNSIGAVGCKLNFPGKHNNKIQHCGVVFSNRKFPYHLDGGKKEQKYHSLNKEFQVVTGAVLLTKAKYYKFAHVTNKSNIPGLDERFIWGLDDVDFCLSLKYKMNKKIMYCGDTNIIHHESYTLKNNNLNKFYFNSNISLLHNKWGNHIIIDDYLHNGLNK